MICIFKRNCFVEPIPLSEAIIRKSEYYKNLLTQDGDASSIAIHDKNTEKEGILPAVLIL
jgi:hypothetical protein